MGRGNILAAMEGVSWRRRCFGDGKGNFAVEEWVFLQRMGVLAAEGYFRSEWRLFTAVEVFSWQRMGFQNRIRTEIIIY